MTPSAVHLPHPVTRNPDLTADLRRKAHTRLAERIDPVRTRHKPLSLLRQDARRTLEPFLDAEIATLTRDDRSRLAEDLITESVWIGLFEELFRSEDVQEILVVGPQRVLTRRQGEWGLTTVRFRDAEQLGEVLAWHVVVSEPIAPAGEMTVGHHLVFPNGFRLLVLIPPGVDGPGPMALYVRGPKDGSGIVTPRSRPVTLPAAPRVVDAPPPPAVEPARPAPAAAPPVGSDPFAELFARTRQRVTERIIASFASAGLSDVNVLPIADLRRVVLAHVIEFCEAENLVYDDRAKERLALEILAGMKR
jgi:hypothetical protein